MKRESLVAMRADRSGGTFRGAFVALAAVAMIFLAPAAMRAADPKVPGPAGKNPPVTLESIPGSTAKRVILTAKSAERLGIETGKGGEEPGVLKQMVSGPGLPPR